MRDIRDLVERLRKNDAKAAISTAHAAPHSIQGEAADEIERLRSLLPQAGATSPDEHEFWRAIKDSTDPEDFAAYVEKYPAGVYVALAKHKRFKLLPPDMVLVPMEATEEMTLYGLTAFDTAQLHPANNRTVRIKIVYAAMVRAALEPQRDAE